MQKLLRSRFAYHILSAWLPNRSTWLNAPRAVNVGRGWSSAPPCTTPNWNSTNLLARAAGPRQEQFKERFGVFLDVCGRTDTLRWRSTSNSDRSTQSLLRDQDDELCLASGYARGNSSAVAQAVNFQRFARSGEFRARPKPFFRPPSSIHFCTAMCAFASFCKSRFRASLPLAS
jgi:hypothetical protein